MVQAISLPSELLYEILGLLRSVQHNPLDILLVSPDFYHIYSQLIYGHLKFTKIGQIKRFLTTFNNNHAGTDNHSIPQPIRNITVDVYNDLRLDLYTLLQAFFSTCRRAPNAEIDDLGRVVFESMKFRFHTHAMDKSLHMIYEALSCVNPRTFTWVGPDPPHHFSAAIVPAALSHVLRALTTHTNLTHLTLTHVKFPDNGEILSLPPFPSLKTLNLSQVIFLQPVIVARFLMSAGSHLEEIRLIDAYQQSIWGPRLRRSHIEKAAYARVVEESSTSQGEDGVYCSSNDRMETMSAEIVARIGRVVICQGKTERIIGGDRVLRDSILI